MTTATEELEREKFERWFSKVQRPAMVKIGFRILEQELVRDIARMSWQARAQMEANE